MRRLVHGWTPEGPIDDGSTAWESLLVLDPVGSLDLVSDAVKGNGGDA